MHPPSEFFANLCAAVSEIAKELSDLETGAYVAGFPEKGKEYIHAETGYIWIYAEGNSGYTLPVSYARKGMTYRTLVEVIRDSGDTASGLIA